MLLLQMAGRRDILCPGILYAVSNQGEGDNTLLRGVITLPNVTYEFLERRHRSKVMGGGVWFQNHQAKIYQKKDIPNLVLIGIFVRQLFSKI